MVSRHFLSTDPKRYNPAGYKGGKAYGGGEYVHYATVSLWVNAIECAAKAGDQALLKELAGALCKVRDNPGVFHDVRHVDMSIVGAVPLAVPALEHRPAVLTASVEGHREMLLERPHELRRVPHPAEKRGLVGLETRNILLHRTRAFEKLLLLGLEPVPRRDDLRERRVTVENAYAAQNLPFADLLRTGHVDEDVEMVRHERVGQHDNATELLYSDPSFLLTLHSSSS